MSVKRRWGLWLGAIVFLVMVASIARSWLAGPSTAPRASDQAEGTRTASAAACSPDERVSVESAALVAGNGVIEPRDRETKVASTVAGRIAAIAVKEGQFVTRSTLLVQLEDGPERAALQAAEGELRASQADYEKTMRGQRKEDIEAAVGDAEAAKARAAQSREAYERTAHAAEGGAATPDELDHASRQAEIDKRTGEATEARRRAVVAGSRYEDILAARARMQTTAARRDQAKEVLERLAVRAPLDGEILQLKYRSGEYITPGANQDPLVVMGDTRRLRVRVDMDERDVGRVSLDAKGFVTADAYTDRRFPGKVVEIGRRMGRKNFRTDDPTERIDTKILEVVLELDDPTGLVPGLRVTGYIQPAATHETSH
jgi:multidrug resistance efflux pump